MTDLRRHTTWQSKRARGYRPVEQFHGAHFHAKGRDHQQQVGIPHKPPGTRIILRQLGPTALQYEGILDAASC